MSARSDALLVNPSDLKDFLGWALRHTAPDAFLPTRLLRLMSFMKDAWPARREIAATHCEVAEMMARRLGFPESVQRTLRYAFEQWDGNGPAFGLKGPETPVASRIVHLAEVLEVAHSFGGASAASDLARKRSGSEFDPELVSVFVELSQRADFWTVIEQESVQRTVMAMKPSAHFDRVSDAQVETVCEVVADFTDISARHSWNHSQVVAEVAVGIGRHLGLAAENVIRLRRAALVHDLGKVAVPSGILQKQEKLSEGEWEAFRLHPYYTERVLSRVDKLSSLAPEAAAHHESINGDGYHRQLKGEQIPLGGRILAVADTYAVISKGQDQPPDPEGVLQKMRTMAGSQLDAMCFEGLVASLGSVPARRTPKVQRPGNLSEREVEVLRELAKGLSNKQIGDALFISDKTVERHFDHIYDKLGVSTRTSAVVFGVQNGIVA